MNDFAQPGPNARQAAIEQMLSQGGQQPMSMPQAASKDGSCIYVDRDMIPPKAARGQKVWILAKVEQLGSKVELTPISAQVVGAEMEGDAEEDSESGESSSQNGGY
jgi:hypothetical protein